MKRFLIFILIIVGLILVCLCSYYVYADYMFEKDQQYYYKPRTIDHATP